METGAIAATVTAHVAAGVQPLDPNAPASLVTLGTTATGYTSSGEGSVVATREFDVVELYANTVGGQDAVNYRYQFMPDERPIIAVSRFLRVRATFATAADMVCYICWDE